MRYRIDCTCDCGEWRRSEIGEWHDSLTTALVSFAAHQDMGWESVCLTPVATSRLTHQGKWGIASGRLAPRAQQETC